MTNVIFLGAKEIGYFCLEQLIKNKQSLDINVMGVLTNKGRHDPKHDFYKLCSDNNITIYNSLEELMPLSDIDFLISVQYHEILKQKHIDLANKLAVNLHMAPLPEYRGCNQFSFAIIDQKKEFGTTLHKMEAGIDNGDILFEKRFEILDEYTVKDLLSVTVEHSKNLFAESLEDLITLNFDAIPQAQLEPTRGSVLHFRNEMEGLKKIDLNWSEDKIARQIKATYMEGFKPPYVMIDNRKYYLVPDE